MAAREISQNDFKLKFLKPLFERSNLPFVDPRNPPDWESSFTAVKLQAGRIGVTIYLTFKPVSFGKGRDYRLTAEVGGPGSTFSPGDATLYAQLLSAAAAFCAAAEGETSGWTIVD